MSKNIEKATPYLFLLPAFLLVVTFVLWPLIQALLMSFQQVESVRQATYVGWANYSALAHDPAFGLALANNTEFMLGSVFLLSPLALVLALTIRSRWTKAKALFRLVLFLPITTSQVVVAIIFSQLLSTRFGLVNAFLAVFKVSPIGWLTDPNLVMVSLVILAVWGFTGRACHDLPNLIWVPVQHTSRSRRQSGAGEAEGSTFQLADARFHRWVQRCAVTRRSSPNRPRVKTASAMMTNDRTTPAAAPWPHCISSKAFR